MPPQLARRAERLAEKLRTRAEVRSSAHASELARALGHQVVTVARLPGGAIGGIDPFTCAIRIVDLVPTRASFTIAHELAEHYTPARIDPMWHEEFCDRTAAALMMPAKAFIDSGVACGWNFGVLRVWWPSCSWNALVRRVADLVPGSAATAWHRQQLRFRQTNPGVELPEHADELEEFVACEALHGSGRSELQLGGVEIHAWRSGPGRAVSVVRRQGGR